MKTLFLTAIIFLAGSVGTAQVVIENPESGTTSLHTLEVVRDGVPIDEANSSQVLVDTGLVIAGMISTSATATLITNATSIDATEHHGVLEFSLEEMVLPESFTADNFTAHLKGVMGAPASSNVVLDVDLFDMSNDQEDFVISEEDYDIFNEVPVTSESVENGAFPEEGIDVTAQLRADLFGDDSTGISTGFILMASGGTGIIGFSGIEDAYIELNLVGSDTDVDIDSDTSNIPDTDSDTNEDSDTSDVTDTDSGVTTDTSSDGPVSTDDSDYWETDDDDSDGWNHDGSDGNVKCDCSLAGSSRPNSIWSLLF